MQIFFEPDILTNGGILNEEESRHCVKVLRHKTGDTIHVIDGKGTRAVCTITKASPNDCQVKIDTTETAQQPGTLCHIAIAPTKSIDRFEWFLEKSTELGINQITPLICQKSERKLLKHPRLERVITAATKQSLRLWRPTLNKIIAFSDFLNQQNPEKQKYIAHCEESDRKELFEELQKISANKDFLILIGPEGDFSDKEIKTALEKGFVPVTLGKTRLRTETAGIAACMMVNLAKED